MSLDQTQKSHRDPIVVALDLSLRGDGLSVEAARVIRDLLAKDDTWSEHCRATEKTAAARLEQISQLSLCRDALYGILFGDGHDQPIEWVAAMLAEFSAAPLQEDPDAFAQCCQEVRSMVHAARVYFAKSAQGLPGGSA